MEEKTIINIIDMIYIQLFLCMKKTWGNRQIFKKILRWILWVFAIFLLFSSSFADYNSFLNNLRQLWIDVDSILKSKEISRYELTRLLNGVNCNDCINPTSDTTSRYSYSRWNDFSHIDGNAFGDISYLGWNYKWLSYYYCVAYVWDNTWMRWYPNWVSPICDGKFCGTRTTTLWEFLQVVLNIADQYVYQKYLVKWSDIKSWMDSLPQWTYAYNYLTNDEKALINKYANNGTSGPLPNEEVLQPYIKYCMFNLKACGMQNFGAIWQWYWPVAELNILYDNDIVEHEKFKDGETNKLVDWKYVLETLYNLFKLIDCDFNYDYDCDWLVNHEDNCPNTYNPSQTDTDWDGIWDVCDDDIDGDGIKNPIGIVDDLWNVIVSKYENGMDNCLFVPNWNQSDLDKNWFWDSCDDTDTSLGMYIRTAPIRSTAPVSVEFQAVTQWSVKWDIVWTFGDWSTDKWQRVSHIFENPGLYTVQASAKWYTNNAQASTTVLIWKNQDSLYSLQISPDRQKISAWDQITFTTTKKWSFDKFQRNFGENNTIDRDSSSDLTRIFKNEWSFMVTVKWFKDGKIVAVANTIIWVWEKSYWTDLTVNNISPNKWEKIVLQTRIAWFTERDITNIKRDFSDMTIVNKNLKQEHTFENEWVYVVMQTITLKNWMTLENFITVYVWDDSMNSSYAIQTEVGNLVTNSTENVTFTIRQVWTLPWTTLVLNNYDDWYSERSYENMGSWPKNNSHKYDSKWIYQPKNTVYVNRCISLSTQATVSISNWDTCLKAYLDWTLSQMWNDMDNDWIPDVCDDDIDGDGLPNLVWVIWDWYSDWDGTWDWEINQWILNMHRNICSLDNCPTVKNKNQMDLNNNWWWDDCDDSDDYRNNNWSKSNNSNNANNNGWNNANWGIDSDWDGIIDSLDACPDLPENYNWIEDFDWCPEIWVENNCSLLSYNYVNGNWSVYPSSPNGWRIIWTDPIWKEPACKWDNCNTLCMWDITKCPSCNGNIECELCKQKPSLCASWTGGTGPYKITAWCKPENIIYSRSNITDTAFSFADILPWGNPCKKCFWFVKDVNGMISDIWEFQVCSSWADWPVITEDPISVWWCTGDNCNICEWDVTNCNSCNGDHGCNLCKLYPQTCGTWTWGVWPYELSARCENNPWKRYKWTNIYWFDFSFDSMFEWSCPCNQCYWIVKDVNWATTRTWTFQACEESCRNPRIHSDGPVWPVPGCTGSNCNNICVWDVTKCNGTWWNTPWIIPDGPIWPIPGCTGNNCPICTGDITKCSFPPNVWPTTWDCDTQISASWNTNIPAPYNLNLICPSVGFSGNWYNISWSCFSFDNLLNLWLEDGACTPCFWSITASWITSSPRELEICNNNSWWTNTGIIWEWPDWPTPCEWANCNNVCLWDVNNCPSCNGDLDCDLCKQNPESCSIWTWWEWPFELFARCDGDNPIKIYRWSEIMSHEFSFANIFEWTCPCKQCHRYVIDSNWIKSETIDFTSCKENCGGGWWSGWSCDLQTSAFWTWTATPPYSLTLECPDLDILYDRTNITDNCFPLDDKVPWQCPCATCYRVVKWADWVISQKKEFSVCAPECDTTLIADWPEWPVPGCSGNDCNDICTWNVNSCPSCNGDPNCNVCENNPVSCGIWTGWVWPFEIKAWCDPDTALIYSWTNISWHRFSFANIFEWTCPCKVCHRVVEDSIWNIAERHDFNVCTEDCDVWWWDGPEVMDECLSCPCNYTDYWNTLSTKDDVKAILFDFWMTTLYTESIPVTIMQYLN